jgi:GTP cyclohydrolase II
VLKRQVQTELPTKWGIFTVYAYADSPEDMQPHLALVHSRTQMSDAVPVRIHSECLTGDLFHSLKCDCGEQLHASLDYIQEHGGILIYLRQEGRGIGLINKLQAYNLQAQGLDTIEANVHLGFKPDQRDFGIAVQILEDLHVGVIDLLTNNPEKISAIDESSIELRSRIPLVIQPLSENEKYMEVKAKIMGHLLV